MDDVQAVQKTQTTLELVCELLAHIYSFLVYSLYEWLAALHVELDCVVVDNEVVGDACYHVRAYFERSTEFGNRDLHHKLFQFLWSALLSSADFSCELHLRSSLSDYLPKATPAKPL